MLLSLGSVRTMVVILVGCVLVTGCKQQDAPEASPVATASPAAAASPQTPAPAAGSAQPSATPASSPAATDAGSPAPAAPKPTASPARPADVPEPTFTPSPDDAGAFGQEARHKYDWQELARLSADAGLPEPPKLEAYPADVAARLDLLIHEAASKRTAESIGMLGCLYHDLMRDRESSERVRECYEKAQSLEPDSYIWPHLLGRLFLRRQSVVRARMEFNKSIELKPNYADNFGWLGDLELVADAPEEARKAYNRFVELKPDEAYGYVGLGEVALRLDETEVARQHFEKALSLDPRHRRLHMGLAKYYERIGEQSSADRHASLAERLIPSPTSKTDPVNLLMARAAGPTSLALARIRMLATTDDTQRADEMRDILLKEFPDNPLLLTGIAEISLLINRLDDSVKYAQKALQHDPKFVRALVCLADCELMRGQPESALANADQALALNRDSCAAYIARGRALQALRRNDEATEAFMRAVEMQPNNVPLRTTTGELLLIQGKLDEAQEWCLRIVQEAEASGKLAPEHAPAYAVLGKVARARGEGDTAIFYLRRALGSDPTRAEDFRHIADLLLQSGRGAEALELSRRLIKACPDVLDYTITYGNLLAYTGAHDQALEHFQQLLKELPSHPGPQYGIASVYRDKKQFDQAAEHLEEAVRLDPTFENAYLMLLDVARSKKDSAYALDVVRRALEKLPASVAVGNSSAWVLATLPNAAQRDPQRAIELAERVVAESERKISNYLDTLACAYAAAGRFEDAVRVMKEAIEVAKAQGQSDLETEFSERLPLFESGKIYIDAEAWE